LTEDISESENLDCDGGDFSSRVSDTERAVKIFSKLSGVLLVLLTFLTAGSGEKVIEKDPVEDFQTNWGASGCPSSAHYRCVNDSTREPDTPDTSDYLTVQSNDAVTDEHGIADLKPNSFNWVALHTYTDLSARSAQLRMRIRNGTTDVASQLFTTSTTQWQKVNWTTPENPQDLRGWLQPEKGSGSPQNVTVSSWYMEINYNDLNPRWRNARSNVSNPTSGESIKLSSQGFDDLNLSNATLATNESGKWENKTGVYGSPVTDIATSDSYSWTNFTWENKSIKDRIIGWRIYYRDSGVYYNDSRTNSTDIRTFNVSSPEIDSPKFNYSPVEAGTKLNITVNASAPSRQEIDTVLVNLTDVDGNIEILNAVMENDSAITDQFYLNRTLVNESSNIGEWKVNVSVRNTLGVKDQNSSTLQVLEKKPPEWRNQAQSKIDVDTGANIDLSAEGYDNFILQNATLATNESGIWENKTMNYGSPENIFTEQVWSQTVFTWSNSSVNNTKIAWRIWYGDRIGQYSATDTQEFFVNGQDINVTDLYLNDSNIIEGEEVKIVSNLSNIGTGKVLQGEINLTIETFNGSWNKLSESQEQVEINQNGFRAVNFSWVSRPGPYRFSIDADPSDKINEIDETNNQYEIIRDVSSHQVFHGGTSSKVELGRSGNHFSKWFSTSVNKTLYFSDVDVRYSFSDLMPLNGTDDLREADKALNLTGHNDSLKNLYDSNRDGAPDNTVCLGVGVRELCETPVIESTNTQSFKTAVLYRKDSDNSFNGSQPLIFASKVNNSKTGKYGVYDYEIKVPSTLQNLEPGTAGLDIYAEVSD